MKNYRVPVEEVAQDPLRNPQIHAIIHV